MWHNAKMSQYSTMPDFVIYFCHGWYRIVNGLVWVCFMKLLDIYVPQRFHQPGDYSLSNSTKDVCGGVAPGAQKLLSIKTQVNLTRPPSLMWGTVDQILRKVKEKKK